MNNVDTEELERKIAAQPIVRIKIADTFPYSKHPFRVVKNKALEMLAKDIKKNGLLNPIVVRVIGFGGRYEILSGHRRMEGLKLNGEEYAAARIMKFNDIEAANVVINSNLLQRDKILPSERAKIYMLRRWMRIISAILTLRQARKNRRQITATDSGIPGEMKKAEYQLRSGC